MGKVRTIKVEENVFGSNERTAEILRERLTEQGVCFLNFMSSPGSGKTTLISVLVNQLKQRYRIGAMDVDIQSTVDADRIEEKTGVRTLQIHNCGLCHIDADMTQEAINKYGVNGLDLLIMENIGNLVCPAEFDTGSHKRICLLSYPEGDDKPLKYPLMFSVSDLVIFTKKDTAGFFAFDEEKAQDRILALNPRAQFISVSAKTGEGMDELSGWIEEEIRTVKDQAPSRS